MFALGFDAFVVAGLLPLISHTYNVSVAFAGMCVAVFTISYALSAPIFATALGGHSARLALCMALSVFIAGNILSATAPTFAYLLVSRAVSGVGAGLFAPFAGASVTFLVEADRKGRALSFIVGGMSLGTVIGVPLGLIIAERVGWQAAFWLVSLLAAVALIGILSLIPKISPPSPPTLMQRISLLRDPRIIGIISVTLLVGMASLGLYTYVAPLLAEANATSNLPLYLWAWGVGGIVGSFSIGHIVDISRRPRFVIVYVAGFLAVVFTLLPLAIPLSFGAPLLFFAWGLLGWSTQVPQQHTLLEIHPDSGAAAVALNGSANYLGSSLGAFFGGLLIEAGTNASHLSYIAAAVAGIGALAAMVILLKIFKRKEEISVSGN